MSKFWITSVVATDVTEHTVGTVTTVPEDDEGRAMFTALIAARKLYPTSALSFILKLISTDNVLETEKTIKWSVPGASDDK